jgi:hypothetical protein
MVSMRKLLLLVVAMAAACGDDDPVRHLDGGMDAPDSMMMIDAPVVPMPVKLTVTLDGQPQAGVKVYFLASDSSVVSNTMTDSAGVATGVLMSGSVTAVNPFSTAQGAITYEVYTFTGVKPGDQLKLDENFGETTTTADITGPEDTDPNTAAYVFSTPCTVTDPIPTPGSGASPMTTMYLTGKCSATTDFLVYSLDSAGKVLHYFYVKDQAVGTTIDFTAKTWAAPTAKTYAITNTTALNDEYYVTQRLASARGEIAVLDLFSTQTPGAYTLDVPAFSQAVSIIQTQGNVGGLTEHRILEWAPFSNAAYTLDAGSKLLVDVTTAPTFDATTHTLSWSEGATGLTPDFTVAVINSFREPSTYWTWSIAGAHGAASLAFPTLPTDVFDFNVMTGDSTNVNMMILGKMPGGYDAVRGSIFTTGGEIGLITTPTGTFSGEMYQNLQLRKATTNRKPIRAALTGRHK